MNEHPDVPMQNTDRELWREREGDYYAPRIFVTQSGGIGIDVGGFVIVQPVREWHALGRAALEAPPPREPSAAAIEAAVAVQYETRWGHPADWSRVDTNYRRELTRIAIAALRAAYAIDGLGEAPPQSPEDYGSRSTRF